MSLLRRSLPLLSRATVPRTYTHIVPAITIRTYKSTTDTVIDTVKKTANNLAESAQSTLHSAKETLTKAANRTSESMSASYNDMNKQDQSLFEKGGNKISEMGQKMKHRAQEAGMMAEDTADEAAFKAKNRFTKSNASDSWQAGAARDMENDFSASSDASHTNSDADSLTGTISRAASGAASAVGDMAHDAKERLRASSEEEGDWSERASRMADNVEKEAIRKSKQWDSQSNSYL
jgi:hypothetical protein